MAKEYLLSSVHVHTKLCDGKNTPEELALSAWKAGLKTLGFSGHSHTPHDIEYCMTNARTQLYRAQVAKLKERYAGSIAINASILVGYHVAGIPGALITVVGSALPPLIIISIISAFYQAFRSNKYVSMAMAGMLAGVAAVIFDVVINMAWPILKKKRLLPIAVMLAAFVATRFFSVNIILIILVCGVIGALDTLYLQKKEVEE